MNLLTFMSFLILAVTILTMVFGVISYFMYKAREKKKHGEIVTYSDEIMMKNVAFLFFEQEKAM